MHSQMSASFLFLNSIVDRLPVALHVFVHALGYTLIIISLLPLVRNDNWVFRVFEYPRSQKLFINLVLLFGFLGLGDLGSRYDQIFLGLLSVNACYLFYQVWPYTSISRKQMKRSRSEDEARQFRLLIANIYQDNRDVSACLRCIEINKPDLVLLVETDSFWKRELDVVLKNKLKYVVAEPLDNTYGIVLYSNLKLMDPKIKYLVENDVPSIHTLVQLRSGETFRLFGLHPKPPVPHETARSTERDAEILLVARESELLKEPVVVAGDLNDVAWSYTTELFLKISKLLDPRRGRGFFNTFNAHYWFLRWPLDHVFCSTHFELIRLKRLPTIGSDHFPIMIDLKLCKQRPIENEKESLEANPSQRAFVQEKIDKAVKR
jgi:endonuclease/exonuclease/phosphatase (EEP) superfamily protein YafD